MERRQHPNAPDSSRPGSRLVAADIRLLSLVLTEPFVAAHGTVTRRDIAVVGIVTSVGPGWGECAALPEPTYSAETATGCYETLAAMLPGLIGSDAAAAINAAAANPTVGPMTRAALHMAAVDAHLRSTDRSLADWLGGGDRTAVPAGAAVGLGSTESVVSRARSLATNGYRRLKLKIEPGHELDVVRAVKGAVPEVEVQVDGNGAFDTEHLPTLIEVARLGVAAIEQPFPAQRVEAAVSLVNALRAEGLSTRVVADEAVADLGDVQRLAALGALSGVSIKPGRVGGLDRVRAIHDFCVEAGLSATAGGMVETGFGRHALAAVAAMPAFDLVGDVSPASRWIKGDPWPDLRLVDGMVAVPALPGVGPRPDGGLLDAATVARTAID